MNLSSELKKDLFRYVKFLFGGGLSLLLNLLITYSLTEFLQLWHMLSFGIALGCEILFLFVYHSYVTFRKDGKFLVFALVVLFISGTELDVCISADGITGCSLFICDCSFCCGDLCAELWIK